MTTSSRYRSDVIANSLGAVRAADACKLDGAADCCPSRTGGGCWVINASRGTSGVVSIATLNVLMPGFVMVVKSLTLALLSSTTDTVILISLVGLSGSGGPRYWCVIPNEPVVAIPTLPDVRTNEPTAVSPLTVGEPGALSISVTVCTFPSPQSTTYVNGWAIAPGLLMSWLLTSVST